MLAFIDDDAIAVPDWASALARPFADPRKAAPASRAAPRAKLAGPGRADDPLGAGAAHRFARARAAFPDHGQPVSTIGTNCAFRRDALLAIGGFDPAFAYHLGRKRREHAHGRAVSAGADGGDPAGAGHPRHRARHRRSSAGVPHDLTAIGRSTATASRAGGDAGWVRASQRRRLLRHLVAGRLDPFAVAPLMATLEAGPAPRARGCRRPSGAVGCG